MTIRSIILRCIPGLGAAAGFCYGAWCIAQTANMGALEYLCVAGLIALGAVAIGGAAPTPRCHRKGGYR